jgi:hypothetical protein
MTMRDRVRNAVRSWLFAEETSELKTLMFQVHNLGDLLQIGPAADIQAALTALGSSVSRLDADCEAAFGRRQEEIAAVQTGLTALRDSEERHYRDLLNTQQEIEQKVDRLLLLLEPQAARLHARRPPMPEWDQVQQQNLAEQVKEDSNGKSIRR